MTFPRAAAMHIFAWLHESYMPKLLKKPGFVGAAHLRLRETSESGPSAPYG